MSYSNFLVKQILKKIISQDRQIITLIKGAYCFLFKNYSSNDYKVRHKNMHSTKIVIMIMPFNKNNNYNNIYFLKISNPDSVGVNIIAF